jgi:hypothetical protein
METAYLKRPGCRQMKEGLKAGKADYLPDVVLAAFLSGAWSQGRDRETNPWVPDEYNHGWAGSRLYPIKEGFS